MSLVKNKMKIVKSKKAQEGAGTMAFGEVIGWLILFALIIFVFFWYSGLGSKIIAILKNVF